MEEEEQAQDSVVSLLWLYLEAELNFIPSLRQPRSQAGRVFQKYSFFENLMHVYNVYFYEVYHQYPPLTCPRSLSPQPHSNFMSLKKKQTNIESN